MKMYAYRQSTLDKLLYARGSLDGELAPASCCPFSFMRPADQLNHARQPKAVISMQVANVDAGDGGRMYVGSQDLSAAAFSAVNQVSTLTVAQRNAGHVSAHARTA